MPSLMERIMRKIAEPMPSEYAFCLIKEDGTKEFLTHEEYQKRLEAQKINTQTTAATQ
ncbi:MAG: hypothetical protein LBE70_05355 [Nitrososphaerota archaeon]|nr:hypothetical protein [Nitrososphaerota archaeon]